MDAALFKFVTQWRSLKQKSLRISDLPVDAKNWCELPSMNPFLAAGSAEHAGENRVDVLEMVVEVE